jgi:acyl transferase domain-containing protein
MTGHECWMAGSSETIYSILMMNNGFIAPNINFSNPDEHSEKLNLVTEMRKAELNHVLTNSFGFGGTNSSLILKKYLGELNGLRQYSLSHNGYRIRPRTSPEGLNNNNPGCNPGNTNTTLPTPIVG